MFFHTLVADDEDINFDMPDDREKEKPEDITSNTPKGEKPKPEKKKILLIAILGVVIIVGVGAYFYLQGGLPYEPPESSPETNQETVSSEPNLPPAPPHQGSQVGGENISEETQLPPEPPTKNISVESGSGGALPPEPPGQ